MSTPRLIKKYPNRRLYDTQTSTYITLVDIKQLVIDQEEFQVVDAKSGDDLTRPILLQIILEEEQAGVPMFTSPVLAQIIRFYGNAMQGFMGSYLEKERPGVHRYPAKAPGAKPRLVRPKQGRTGRLVAICQHAVADAADHDDELHRAEQEPLSCRCKRTCRTRRARCSPGFPFTPPQQDKKGG
jgi:polyhydroxyalkanoate synthesis repressor PhaR